METDTARTEKPPAYSTDGSDPEPEPDQRPLVTSPEEAAEVLGDAWRCYGVDDRECCVMVTLNTRHRMIGQHLVSTGSLDHTFLNPRDVYRIALADNAAAIVIAHNHPSGDPTPSSDDTSVTRRLVAAGDVIGIDLLDHLVLAHDPEGRRVIWRSLARMGHC